MVLSFQMCIPGNLGNAIFMVVQFSLLRTFFFISRSLVSQYTVIQTIYYNLQYRPYSLQSIVYDIGSIIPYRKRQVLTIYRHLRLKSLDQIFSQNIKMQLLLNLISCATFTRIIIYDSKRFFSIFICISQKITSDFFLDFQ